MNINQWLKIVSFILFFMLLNERIVSAHEWMAPKIAAQLQNPVPFTHASIDKGNKIFEQMCAHCHGLNAQGKSGKSIGLKENPPNLPKRLKTHSAGDIHWKIKNGREEMPSFKDDLSDDEIWDIVNYISSIDR